MTESIDKINLKIFLLSYVINPGAILTGLAVFGLVLGKEPFKFLSSHSLTNYLFLIFGVILLIINFVLIINLEKRKKSIKEKSN